MDFDENGTAAEFWLKSVSPNNRGLWHLKPLKNSMFKVDFSPIARKGVESVIVWRMLALMQFTAPQI